MGDGVSDLIGRGEAGEEDVREYIMSRIENAQGTWRIHQTSQMNLRNGWALNAMKDEGIITVERDVVSQGWLVICKKPTQKEGQD